MKLITYAESFVEIEELKHLGVLEILLAPKSISRFSTLADDQVIALAQHARDLGLRPILVWDQLMTDASFERALTQLSSLLPLFDVVRVYDPGAVEYLFVETDKQIQLLLELSGHNLAGLLVWQKYLGSRLDRIIPSYELDQETLKYFRSQLSVPLEVYGLGPLSLSYTPRPLLTPYFAANNQEVIRAQAHTEEVHQSDLTIVQNQHGTFTFNGRDFSLVEFMPLLQSFEINCFMVDLRHLHQELRKKLFISVMNVMHGESAESFKSLYPRPTFRGFFVKNKSDAVFSKLKNQKRDRQLGELLAEVLDVSKGKYLGAMVRHPHGMQLGQAIMLRSPEGKEKHLVINQLFDAAYLPVAKVAKDHLAYIPAISGMSSKALIFCGTSH